MALRESETKGAAPPFPQALLLALLQNTDELVAAVDLDMRYIAFSSRYQREFQRIFGVTISQGTSLRDALAHRPADQAKALDNCRRALAGEEFTVTEKFGDENRSRSVYQARFTPVRDSDERITATLHRVLNMTARRAEKLKRSEAERKRLKAVVDCMTEAVIVTDPSGAVVSMNPAALAMHDFSSLAEATRSASVFTDLFEMTYPDGHAVPTGELPFSRAMRGEAIPYVQIHFRNKRTGKTWMAAQSAAPVRNAAGRVILIVITIRDITERKRMEQRLRESEERSRLAMQAGRMYAWEWNPRSDGVLRSSAKANLFGLSEDAMQGTGHEYFQEIHSDDRERFIRLVRDLTPENDRYDTEYRVVRSDGQITTLQESARASFDENGRMIRLIGMSADVSERARVQAALRETEERFRKMADTAPVLIWVSGPDKLCTFFNKRWLDFTGRSMEQELGNGWTAGVHPDDLDRCCDIYYSSFDSRRDFQMEYRLRRSDGEYRWLLDTGVPRIEEGGIFVGYIGSCIDITDLKRAQEEVLEGQKLESLGMLAGGIAHDFNNLLGGIVSEAELAMDELPIGWPPYEQVQSIRTIAMRAAEIIRELMIYAGQETATVELVDISELVSEMLQLVAVSISKRAVVKTDLPENLAAVRANPAQMRQVVMNLILNASEAIGDNDGVITVRTRSLRSAHDTAIEASKLPEGDYLVLEIADTGCGMSEEVRAKMFDPFFTTKFAGRGLGLAVVQGIVRGHGGAIHLSSAPGRGTCIQILLPSLSDTARRREITAVPASHETHAAASGSVLVVEDEDTLRFAVSRMLRKRGFGVIEAADGNAAIDLFRAHTDDVDIVLLDLTIPGLPSREVWKEMRRIRPEIKVILTTAYSREIVAARPDWAQAAAFIRKPYRLEQLVRLLAEALA